MPAREALRALEAEGFVESKPCAGSTVSRIPVDGADDLFFVREALSGSTSLTALLRQIAGKIEWLYATDFDTRGKESWSEHRIILAIDAGNFAEAEKLMARHVHQSREGYVARFSPE